MLDDWLNFFSEKSNSKKFFFLGSSITLFPISSWY